MSPAVVDLGSSMVRRDAAEPTDRGRWFTIAVQNTGGAPVARILTAAEPAGTAILIAPPVERPSLIEAAGSDPSLVIQREAAYGNDAFRVIVAPQHAGTLALHFVGVAEAPSVLAWSEPALIAHNRQVANLNGLVAGLLTAALGFAAGAAVLSGRLFARWATLFLAAVLLADLASNGYFDGGWLTMPGGPYGLAAFAFAIAVAAAVRLVDYIAAFDAFRPHASVWRDRVSLAIIVTGIAAFAGVPVAGVLIRAVALVGAAAAAGYLAHCGRVGIAGARRLAPAATIFALVTAVAALDAVGFFGLNLVAQGAIGGFAAAGALLVALTASIPTEHAMERLREFREIHRHDDIQATLTDEAFDSVRERAAVSASHQGVFDLDLKSGLLSLSSEAAHILGLPAETAELGREAWIARILPEDRTVYEQALETYRREPGTAFRLEFRARAGARTVWLELRATMTGDSAEADRCLGLIADVSARKSANAPEPAAVDALTGLGTRAALLGQLENLGDAFGRATLAIVDIDRFKAVNDSLGPGGADALLKAVAARLSESIGGPQSRRQFFRASGDMFAVLAFDVADAAFFGQSLTALFDAPFPVAGREAFLPVSIGLASAVQAENGDDLLAQAELAMIDAKRQGGARACVYSSALTPARAPDSVALETELRYALERGEIEVHYQPIVKIADDMVAGFEALLRWRHPGRGLIEPDAFIPYAEQSGLIAALGDIALRQALRDLKEWQRAFPSDPPLFVSVNVAWRQLANEDFYRTLSRLLIDSRLPKRSLRLEITESAVMAGKDRAEAALERLKKLGAGLAIDDFGTGHSALAHLRRFPFDTIKIDKSFLAAAHERSGAAILQSIIALAHDLKLAVVAEGVESEAHLERLVLMGCEFGQGYLFGPPMAASVIPDFIAAPIEAAGATASE